MTSDAHQEAKETVKPSADHGQDEVLSQGSHGPVVHGEAQKLAELGTYTLIGDYESSQKLQSEIHRLEKDPAHMKLVADELSTIQVVGSDKLPVHASVETDKEGHVTSLDFHSSKDLEKIAYEKEAKYQECMFDYGGTRSIYIQNSNEPDHKENRKQGKFEEDEALRKEEFRQYDEIYADARRSCKEFDSPANGVAAIPTNHEMTVLTPAEQKTLADFKNAIEADDQEKLSKLLKPYLGKGKAGLEFLRIADTDPIVRPYSYSLEGGTVSSLRYPKKDQSGYNKFEAD